MYLVTKGKGGINQLGYSPKTKEYVCIHKGKEIWREKGNTDLLELFYSNKLTRDAALQFDIYRKYEQTCDEMGF